MQGQRGAAQAGDAHMAGEGSRSLALLVVDDDSNCIHASADACRMLGIERNLVMETALIDLIAEFERERFTHIWHAFREGGGHAGPFRVERTGAEIDVKVTAEVLPSRHLVLLAPAGGRAGRASVSRPDWRPETSNGEIRAAGRSRSMPSAREREILRLVAAGATDEQIAVRLQLSPATVRTHVRNAKAKLGAQTRAQAVALALQQRLIELTS